MEDYWDEYENKNLESSSDESDCDEPSSDLPSSDQEEEEVTWDYRREAGTWESLVDDERMAITRDWRTPFWANIEI